MYLSDNMILQHKDGVGLLTFPRLSEFEFIKHAFTTRQGGVSEGMFSSMNLSFGRGDTDENVRENHRILAKALDIDSDKIVASAQDHQTYIRHVTEKEAGIGIWKSRDLQSVDGLVTNTPGITLITYYADCAPIYFVDPVHRAVGLAHAGWRGTVAQIGGIAIKRMEEVYGSRAEEMVVAIGPSIGACCFEVDQPVRDAFASLTDLSPSDFICDSEIPGKYRIDLWEVNARILIKAGVSRENVIKGEVCTVCNSELLFSHRATQGKRGGLAAVISII